MKGAKSEAGGTYRHINREDESLSILRFQETGDENIFEDVYLKRLETINYLAGKYTWLGEDMKSEVREVFMKAVRGYKRGKKHFNTYFYTAVLNHFRNIMKAKSRSKRTLIDGSNPEDSFLRLDETVEYLDCRSASTYHDVVTEVFGDWSLHIDIRDFIRTVERTSWILSDVMMDVASCGTVPTKRRIYTGRVKIMDGESMVEAMKRAVGISKPCYKVVSIVEKNGNADYRIDVSCRRCAHEIGRLLQREYRGESQVDVV